MTQPAPFSSNNITDLYKQAHEANAFTQYLGEVPLLNFDHVTEGQLVDVLVTVWGLDNPEDVIEKFGFKKVVRKHNSFVRKAQRGKLPPIKNPAGYMLRTLEGKTRPTRVEPPSPDQRGILK